ncbi:MAG: twin-arginine translocase TatA/TatE family subunit [Helicobacteraceae bacterium]|nr:twin-arginine translocase TatA/TatE family subunit [Helicobacteraceae bacterium]
MPQIPGGFELVLILAVVLLLFGGKKIPELAKGLGQGIKNFKKSLKDDEGAVADDLASTDELKKVDTAEADVVAEAPKTAEKQA